MTTTTTTTTTTVTPVKLTSILDSIGTDQGNVLGHNLTALGIQVGGDYTDDSRPVLQGTAPAGATIAITDDGHRLGTTTADAGGQWTFDLGPATFGLGLANGLHTLQAWALTADGLYDPIDPARSATESLYVDALQPTLAGRLQITGVTDDIGPVQGAALTTTDAFVPVAVDDRQPTFTGTASPNELLWMTLSDDSVTEVRAGLTGQWQFTPARPLPNGVATLDVAGTDTTRTDRLMLDIQAGSGRPPVITAVLDHAGTPMPSGTATPERQPTLQGTAEPGTDIEVYANGTLIGHAQTAADWSWSFTPTQDLPAAASWQFTVVAVSGTDHTPAPYAWALSGSDTARAPRPPVITSLTDDVGPSQGTLVGGQGVIDDPRPTLAGTSEPGTQVEVFDQGVRTGTVTAGSDWTWSWTPGTDLAAGHHAFTVTAQDPVLGTRSSSPWAFTADIAADPVTSRAPVITDVLYLGHVPQPRVPDGGAIEASVVTLRGTAEPGTRIEVFDNGRLMAAVITPTDGAWEAPVFPANAGTHAYTAQARWLLDGQETMVSSPAYTIHVDTGELSLLAPVIAEVIDNVGPAQGLLGNDAYTDDHLLQMSGTAQPGCTVEIYDNSVKIGQALTGSDWQWSFSSPALPDGSHSFSALAVSPDGLASAPTQQTLGVTIGLETATLGTPTLTALIDDVGPWQGTLTNPGPDRANFMTDDPRPTLVGTSDAGTVVEVVTHQAGVTTRLGFTTADASGEWRLTPAVDLPFDGQWRELEVIARSTTDAAAVASNRTNTGTVPGLTLIADQQQAAAPTLYSILDDMGSWQGPLPLDTGTVRTDDPQPTFTGTAAPGATVILEAYADQFLRLGSTTADAQGQWSFTPSEPLAATLNGPMDLLVNAVSPAGMEPPLQLLNLHSLLVIGPDLAASATLDSLLAGAGLTAAASPSATASATATPDVHAAMLPAALPDAVRHDLAY